MLNRAVFSIFFSFLLILSTSCSGEVETGAVMQTSGDSPGTGTAAADSGDTGDDVGSDTEGTADGIDGEDGSDGVGVDGNDDGGDTATEPACTEGNAQVACNDSNPCTDDSCADGLCVNALAEGDCDDGDACTSDDLCVNGQCSGAPLDCDDGEFCTNDECDSATGCIYISKDGAECDDGDICTEIGTCQIGACSGVEPVNCNDDNACTTDSCDAQKGCKNDLVVSHDCRPNIVVSYPPRAASIVWEDLAKPTITVTGTVTSGAGEIVEFTLNGLAVNLSDDGSFSTEITPHVGGNTLEFDAKDSMNSARKRVQSFHWSPKYNDPKEEEVTIPCDGVIAEGSCFKAGTSNGVQWSPAEQACQENGGHLAVIHSELQNDAVKVQIESVCGEASAWIGMNDNAKEGLYVWADGTEIGYTNWAENEPNDWNDDEDVIGIYASGEWNDFNGDTAMGCYVCSYPTSKTVYTGHADPGMGIFLGPTLLDDGIHDLPPNDLATVFEMVFSGFDFGKMIPNPAATGVSAAGGTYDVYINDIKNEKPTVALTLIDGGWAITAKVANLTAKIEANKTQGSFFLPNKITGTMKIKTITILADVFFGVTPDHALDAWVDKTDVSIDGVSVDIDGILGGIIEGLLGGSIGSMMEDMEKQIGDELGGVLAPMLVDALGALAFGFEFELPSISQDADPVQMDVTTDFSWVSFKTDGDILGMRAIALAKTVVVTHESKGAPAREGCGKTVQGLEVLDEAPMEIVMLDDTVNLILYSAWRGGFLEFDLPPELLGDFDLEAIGVKGLVATISGLLAPTVSDCQNGTLLLHIGDIKLVATMEFMEKPLDLVGYASFDAKFELVVVDGEIVFGVNDIANVKLELTAIQDEQIGMEPLLASLIQANLVPALMDGLSGDALGGLPLPDVQMDAAGTPVSIGITPLWVKRVNGNNIVGAELKSE